MQWAQPTEFWCCFEKKPERDTNPKAKRHVYDMYVAVVVMYVYVFVYVIVMDVAVVVMYDAVVVMYVAVVVIVAVVVVAVVAVAVSGSITVEKFEALQMLYEASPWRSGRPC